MNCEQKYQYSTDFHPYETLMLKSLVLKHSKTGAELTLVSEPEARPVLRVVTVKVDDCLMCGAE